MYMVNDLSVVHHRPKIPFAMFEPIDADNLAAPPTIPSTSERHTTQLHEQKLCLQASITGQRKSTDRLHSRTLDNASAGCSTWTAERSAWLAPGMNRRIVAGTAIVLAARTLLVRTFVGAVAREVYTKKRQHRIFPLWIETTLTFGGGDQGFARLESSLNSLIDIEDRSCGEEGGAKEHLEQDLCLSERIFCCCCDCCRLFGCDWLRMLNMKMPRERVDLYVLIVNVSKTLPENAHQLWA